MANRFINDPLYSKQKAFEASMTKKSSSNLVFLEGLDGCGKDTQADLLVQRLWYTKMRLPYYQNKTWRLLRECIDNWKKDISEEFFQSLMLANYVETYDDIIKPMLEEWRKIVCTRFTPSMIAYWRAFWASRVYLTSLQMALWDYMQRDNTTSLILLNISLQTSLERIAWRDKSSDQKRENIFENKKILKKVYQCYEENYSMFSDIVQADRDIEEVYKTLQIILWKI